MAVGQRVGYARVSSLGQNPDRQLDGVEVDTLFTDIVSGKSTARPQLQAMLAFVRAGDLVIVHSINRLARNLDDLRRLVRELTARGARDLPEPPQLRKRTIAAASPPRWITSYGRPAPGRWMACAVIPPP